MHLSRVIVSSNFLRRSAGIRCKDCQPGMDIVIPILYVRTGKQPDIKEPNHLMSYWSIQVKNRIADTMDDVEVQSSLTQHASRQMSFQRRLFVLHI
jgi:uncharacterized protein YbcV (DUF1398 family)